jgi:hypothetical protein
VQHILPGEDGLTSWLAGGFPAGRFWLSFNFQPKPTHHNTPVTVNVKVRFPKV